MVQVDSKEGVEIVRRDLLGSVFCRDFGRAKERRKEGEGMCGRAKKCSAD